MSITDSPSRSTGASTASIDVLRRRSQELSFVGNGQALADTPPLGEGPQQIKRIFLLKASRPKIGMVQCQFRIDQSSDCSEAALRNLFNSGVFSDINHPSGWPPPPSVFDIDTWDGNYDGSGVLIAIQLAPDVAYFNSDPKLAVTAGSTDAYNDLFGPVLYPERSAKPDILTFRLQCRPTLKYLPFNIKIKYIQPSNDGTTTTEDLEIDPKIKNNG
jgi:hypothetical protein